MVARLSIAVAKLSQGSLPVVAPVLAARATVARAAKMGMPVRLLLRLRVLARTVAHPAQRVAKLAVAASLVLLFVEVLVHCVLVTAWVVAVAALVSSVAAAAALILVAVVAHLSAR